MSENKYSEVTIACVVDGKAYRVKQLSNVSITEYNAEKSKISGTCPDGHITHSVYTRSENSPEETHPNTMCQYIHPGVDHPTYISITAGTQRWIVKPLWADAVGEINKANEQLT